jgi:sugar O-acyltransferase (sialic acid O-acetyltransferase NeuD family)
MKDLIIVGSGGHARSVIDAVLMTNQLPILGVLDICTETHKEEKVLGIPVIGNLKHLEKISPNDVVLFLAIGNNSTRRWASVVCSSYGFKSINIVHPLAYISKFASLGHGNFIGAFANIGAGARIGNYCIVNTLANIEHEVNSGNFCQFGPASTICGRTSVGDDVFVGAGATIIDRLFISSRVIVGAGAVVTKSIAQSGNKYIGVPARRI